MIRFRDIESTTDLCCLPSPYRIAKSVAGMAFNFSEVKVAPRPAERKARVQTPSTRTNSASTRVRESISCFANPQFSMAT